MKFTAPAENGLQNMSQVLIAPNEAYHVDNKT